jgi:Ulp1 family protease
VQFERLLHKQQLSNLDQCGKMIVAVHVAGNHWGLLVADFERKTIRFIDSLARYNQNRGRQLKEALKAFINSNLISPKQFGEWDCSEHIDHPFQSNGFDCGIFAMIFANLEGIGKPLNSLRVSRLKCYRWRILG